MAASRRFPTHPAPTPGSPSESQLAEAKAEPVRDDDGGGEAGGKVRSLRRLVVGIAAVAVAVLVLVAGYAADDSSRETVPGA